MNNGMTRHRDGGAARQSAADQSHAHVTREHTESWDGRQTPPWVVVAAAILLSIPLALCCYLLLKL
jgi:hypothetical protein